jgi:hypothetical protein
MALFVRRARTAFIQNIDITPRCIFSLSPLVAALVATKVRPKKGLGGPQGAG